MGMPIDTFRPISGGSAVISVTATSAATALPGAGAGELDEDLRVHNAGTGLVFLEFGGSGAVATNDGASMVVPVGATQIFRVKRGQTHVAAICPAAGTATLYVTRGAGGV